MMSVHVKLLGLLPLRMLIGFGLWLRLLPGLCGLQMSKQLGILGQFVVGRWRWLLERLTGLE